MRPSFSSTDLARAATAGGVALSAAVKLTKTTKTA